jgi:hypothetical protein
VVELQQACTPAAHAALLGCTLDNAAAVSEGRWLQRRRVVLQSSTMAARNEWLQELASWCA